jgi:hypothetical protein
VRPEEKESAKAKGRKKAGLGSISLSQSGATLSIVKERGRGRKEGEEEGEGGEKEEEKLDVETDAKLSGGETNEKDGAALPLFPSSKWLTSRFKQILHQLTHYDPDAYNDKASLRGGLSHSGQHGAHATMHVAKGGRGDDRKHMKMKDGWSKRENMDFYRFLMTHGLPVHSTKVTGLLLLLLFVFCVFCVLFCRFQFLFLNFGSRFHLNFSHAQGSGIGLRVSEGKGQIGSEDCRSDQAVCRLVCLLSSFLFLSFILSFFFFLLSFFLLSFIHSFIHSFIRSFFHSFLSFFLAFSFHSFILSFILSSCLTSFFFLFPSRSIAGITRS